MAPEGPSPDWAKTDRQPYETSIQVPTIARSLIASIGWSWAWSRSTRKLSAEAEVLVDELNKRQLSALRNAARSGRFQVLLGAGSSVGAINSHGSLPLASDLVRLIARRFPTAPIPPNASLQRAYNRAVEVSSLDIVWKYFNEVFSNSRHEEWFSEFALLPWRRIWTLNVDDTFENAYRDGRTDAHPKLVTISWDEPYVENDDLQVIHLHGHVLGRDVRPLVFSFAEYQKLAATRPVWHQMLGGVIGSEPLLILGARVLDDPDIEALVLGQQRQADTPAILVDPYVSEDNAWELQRAGFTIARISMKEFVQDWVETCGLQGGDPARFFASLDVRLPQFVQLETNRVVPPPRTHNYFSGDAPLWSDAVAQHVALFEWMRDAIGGMEDWLGASIRRPRLHIIYARRFTGASSGLFRVARECVSKHASVYLFDRSSRFSIPPILDLCRTERPIVLLVDGAADFADDIDELMIKASDISGASLYVLVTETEGNDLRLEGRLEGAYERRVTRVPRHLNIRDADCLLTKLEEFGRMGALELLDHKERRARIRSRDVFSAMYEMEHAAGFARRIEVELSELSEWQQDLLFLLALASSGNREVSSAEAAVAIGASVARIVHGVDRDEHLSALLEINAGLLRSRQRDRNLKWLIHELGDTKALIRLTEMIQRLAPLATSRSLAARNRPALLIGHLMSARNLLGIFGHEDLDGFYDALRPVFGDWNGRFWEQRAIYAKHLAQVHKDRAAWGQAESYAARAVQLYDSAFTRTTYGTILINRANDLARYSDSHWRDYYLRGLEQFDLALAFHAETRITTFALLHAVLDLAISLNSLVRANSPVAADAIDVRETWERHYARLRVSLVGQEELESARRAEELSRRWEREVRDELVALEAGPLSHN